jgi:exopolysaccharide biosynthesis polyprenyl glycosylphosphotransferase
MFARHNRMISVLYVLADAALAGASFWAAYVVRNQLHSMRPLYPAVYYYWLTPVVILTCMGVGLATGIYREIREELLYRVFADPLKVALISTTLLFAFISALQLAYISRLLLGLYGLIDLTAAILFRLMARRFSATLRRAFSGWRHFLLVGDSRGALEIARHIELNENRGTRLDGFAAVNPGAAGKLNQQGLRRQYPVYSLAELPQLLRQRVIDEVIFAVSKDELDAVEPTFLICEQEGVRTRLLLSFFPQTYSRVSLERLREMPLLTFSTTPENDYLLLAKRLADFLMALTLVIILSPLLLTLALLIKLTSLGPVLYIQTRCGLGGRQFRLYKFRSMRVNADMLQAELRPLNEVDGPVFKMKNDPRCTSIGRVMRKFSLDELPQLLNILKGDMSFVGPRPPLPEEVERYEPWQRRRLRMKPGLTCLWALEGRSALDFRRWMELDLEYIDHWSPALDWKILAKTIPVVLSGRGAS